MRQEKDNKPSIVFFGSGPVAASSLQKLERYLDIEAVITKPSTTNEMKVTLSEPNIFSVNSKAELDELIKVKNLVSKVAILIDFGIIVSQKVIDKFEFGIINSHFSLLPQWRGADPISFSILSGQSKTGVSLMVLDQGMDTGKILVRKSLKLSGKESTPDLTEKLIDLSDDLLKANIPKYLSNQISPINQPHPDRATYSRKLTKNDSVLDFNKPASLLEREIRAFIDWPKSRTQIAEKDVVILKASVKKRTEAAPIGTIYKTEDKKIGIHCKQDDLIIETLKPASKKEMTSEAFLAGHQL